MIKAVEVISDTNIGGAGILLLNRLKHTDKSMFDTVVILPKGSLLSQRLRVEGIRVIEIDGCYDSSLDIKGYSAYKHIFKRLKPDMVNCHGSLSARIAAYISKVPLKVYTRHCVYPAKPWQKSKLSRKITALITNVLTDNIIAVAYSAKKNLEDLGVPAKKISVVINGAEPLREMSEEEKSKIKQELGIKSGEKVVTICARLEACKDHKTFLKAAYLLSKSGRYKFLIVGGGSLENKLKRLCKEMGLEKRVIFTGFIQDVSPYMNVTDINVNCSVGTETSSLALSEGMSLGKPSVVSDYGGNPYMVRQGVNGYIYKARDYRDLARKIRIIAADRELYKAMSKSSLERYQSELNASSMAHKTQSLYAVWLLSKIKSDRGV